MVANANELPVSKIDFASSETTWLASARIDGKITVTDSVKKVRVVGLMTDPNADPNNTIFAAYFTVADKDGKNVPYGSMEEQNNMDERECYYEFRNCQIPKGSIIDMGIERTSFGTPVRITIYLDDVKVYETTLQVASKRGGVAELTREWSILHKATLEELKPGQYVDTVGHWAEEFVATAAVKYGANCGANEVARVYRPDDAMTRAMFVEMLVKMGGEKFEPSIAYGESPFDDVDMWSDSYPSIRWAHANGIVLGTGSGFDPNGPLTRQDIAVILSRYFEYKSITLSNAVTPIIFKDGQLIDDYARRHVANLQSADIVTGDPDGSYRPKDFISKAEGITVLCRLCNNGIIG